MDCSQIDRILDDWMDDAVAEEDRRALEEHVAGCTECAARWRATEQMKKLFSEMAPEIDVPLKAQADWRAAVKAEATNSRRRRITRWASGIAAALVVLVGVAAFMGQGPSISAKNAAAPIAASGSMVQESTLIDGEYEVAAGGMVEADGMPVPEPEEMFMESAEEAVGSPAPMVELTRNGCDIDAECALIGDLVAEYEGVMDVQPFEAGGSPCVNLFIDLPAENAQEFIDAASAGHDDEGYRPDYGFSDYVGENVSILMVLRSNAN